jgi:hypothetical protein
MSRYSTGLDYPGSCVRQVDDQPGQKDGFKDVADTLLDEAKERNIRRGKAEALGDKIGGVIDAVSRALIVRFN